MKKIVSVLIFTVFISLTVYSQATIFIGEEGERSDSELQQEDDLAIYFSDEQENIQLASLISNTDIVSITQNTDTTKLMNLDVFSVGVGIGMDYGGIGTNLCYYPQRNIGLFVGLGHAIVNPAINVGLKVRFASKDCKAIVNPYLLGMYGYYAAIKVGNDGSLNKLFYGTTIGCGIDIRSCDSYRGYYSLSLLIPVREKSVSEYERLLESKGYEFLHKLQPVAISFGYKF